MRKDLKKFDIFSQPSWTSWETEPDGSLGFVCHNSNLGTLLCLCRILVESEFHSVCFFWIPDFMRNVLTIFEIFSQPYGLVGKLNQPVHWVLFAGTTVWVLCFVCVSSWSFGVEIALCLYFWIPDSMRNFLECFDIFSQSNGLVGKSNQPVHWVLFFETSIWVLCFICVGSWSFEVKISLHLFFWIPESIRKVLTSFEIFSQPAGPIGKPNQLVHYVQFFEIAVLVLCFVCVDSHSFGVGILLRLFFWIPDFVRKVLKKF